MSENTSESAQQQQIKQIWMEIRRATDGNGAEIVKFPVERLSIPQGPIPNNVIGFGWIQIWYVDQNVIEFLQRIRRLFDSSGTNVFVNTRYDESRNWEIIRQKIWPLISDNICGFCLCLPSRFKRLRRFSPTILRNCVNLRLTGGLLFPCASSHQAVAKWLLTPREAGLPKMFYCNYCVGVEGLKRSFFNASAPVNFITRLYASSAAGTGPFELKNNWTGERLTFRRLNEYDWLLVRCPIVREEAKWAKWEKEAIEWEGYCQCNRISIFFRDSGIGDE
uniref:Uncharacterized protein n=1 Tax=Globodera pallida TaxID=36090 RepID=A0A183CEI6_GLOPA